MWRAFRLWLSQFNPIRVWREERRLDREAQILCVEELCSVLREQAQVATKALDMSAQFLKNFEVHDAPTTWNVRDEDEVRAWRERHNLKPEDLDGYDS